MSTSEQAQTQSAAETVAQFQAGLIAADPDRTRAALGPVFFMADERTSDGSGAMNAHMFLSEDRLERWPQDYLDEAGPPENVQELVSVSLRRSGAMVHTRDTGRNRFRQWENEGNVWVLGRVGDSWQIIGQIVRDMQLPSSAG